MLCLCKLAVLLAHYCCLLEPILTTTIQDQAVSKPASTNDMASWTTDRKTYQPHDLIKATVTFQQPIPGEPSLKIRHPAGAPRFRVVDEKLLSKQSNSGIQQMVEFTIEPLGVGVIEIGPLEISAKSKSSAGTKDGSKEPNELLPIARLKPIQVTVESAVDLSSLKLIEPEPLPDTARSSWLILLLIALFGMVLATVAYSFLRRPTSTTSHHESLRQRAINAIQKLEGSSELRRDPSAFHARLVDIIRQLLESTTSISARKLTTPEFLAQIEPSLEYGTQDKRRLKEFLNHADRIKFAGEVPSDELIADSIRLAYRFVEKYARQDEQEPKPS